MRWSWVLIATGCTGSLADPLVEAHRGAAAYWPENSRAAVIGATAAGFDGLHLELALTSDHEAVLASHPWLDPDRCTDAAGQPLADRVFIEDLTLAEVVYHHRCGGLGDPAFPDAEVVAEPPLALDELLLLIRDHAPADQRIRLDLTATPHQTPPPVDWLEPVLDRWWAADLPQPLVISAADPDALRAFEDHARVAGRDLHTALRAPGPRGSDVLVGLAWERDRLLGRLDLVDLVTDAGADGIVLPHELAEHHQLLALREAGFEIGVIGLDGAALPKAYARWPIDVLVTDRPAAE